MSTGLIGATSPKIVVTESTQPTLLMSVAERDNESLESLNWVEDSIKPRKERTRSLKNRSSAHHAQFRSNRTPDVIDSINTMFPIRVTLMAFIRCVDIPIISHKAWKEIVVKSYLTRFSQPGYIVDSFESINNEVNSCLIEHSSILQRVNQAVESLVDLDDLGFLKNFSNESNAVRFYDKYHALVKNDCYKGEFIRKVIGGDQALKIIKSSGGSEVGGIHEKLQSQLDIVLSAEKKKAVLLNSSFEFQINFDIEHLDVIPIPICLFNYREFTENFRSLYSDGPFQDGIIRINGENLVIPDYNKLGVKDEDRQVYFQKWLICELQKKMTVEFTLSEAEQVEIFAEETKLKGNPKKLNRLIIKELGMWFSDNPMEKKIPQRITCLLQSLKVKKDSQDFAEHMLEFPDLIGKYLIKNKGFLEKNWDQVSTALIELYGRFYNLKKKQESIPSLALLQAMFFAGYASGEILLRKTVCPHLFGGPINSCRLILNRDLLTAFDISVYKDSFVVKHVKLFRIVEGDIVKATPAVHWIVKGNLRSMDYAAALEIPEFAFAPDSPGEERLSIVNQFQLDCDNSPWGPHLMRTEKK